MNIKELDLAIIDRLNWLQNKANTKENPAQYYELLMMRDAINDNWDDIEDLQNVIRALDKIRDIISITLKEIEVVNLKQEYETSTNPRVREFIEKYVTSLTAEINQWNRDNPLT